MILIGMGANLLHPQYGEPLNSLKAAAGMLENRGLQITHQSSWYRTEPVPVSDQPWFVNAVLAVSTELKMQELLLLLHSIEQEFGRVREVKWEARVLDLDLLAYNDEVSVNQDQSKGGVVPHPRMHERGFVLAPLCEINPDWQHPVTGRTATELFDAIKDDLTFEIVPQQA
ncbi:MAG: 2-amino-4-hydroxy-6-hydroxymethyldihydropteridine diphosphokinase [Sneathiella sp.]|nr:2-amino-4-hydroxy-6-hydroxymethyldihydropteridine diphosphokinase [Sneathiella sp.]